jgi:hypothetical protein
MRTISNRVSTADDALGFRRREPGADHVGQHLDLAPCADKSASVLRARNRRDAIPPAVAR